MDIYEWSQDIGWADAISIEFLFNVHCVPLVNDMRTHFCMCICLKMIPSCKYFTSHFTKYTQIHLLTMVCFRYHSHHWYDFEAWMAFKTFPTYFTNVCERASDRTHFNKMRSNRVPNWYFQKYFQWHGPSIHSHKGKSILSDGHKHTTHLHAGKTLLSEHLHIAIKSQMCNLFIYLTQFSGKHTTLTKVMKDL